MARTTATDVDEILDTSITNLTPYVEAANDIVDRIADKDSSISTDTLTRIEKFYAAYLATAQDPRAESLSAETRSVSYADRTTDATAGYKELAESLDPTGTIANINKPKATLSVPDSKGLE